jgi:hypothetical protein
MHVWFYLPSLDDPQQEDMAMTITTTLAMT